MRTFGLDVSVLVDPHKTGIAVYTYELIKALIKLNNKDKFVIFGLSPRAAFENLNSLEFRNYSNVEMKIYKMPARAFRYAFLFWQKIGYPNIEKFTGPVDLFHSFNWYLPPQKSGKAVATVFDMTSILFPDWHQEKTVQLDSLRLNRIKEKADLVVTISENSKRDFLKLSPKSRVEVIYPAVSENFKVQIDQSKIKKVLAKYNLTPEYFLSVATLEPRKNIVSLIEAYLKSNLPNKLVLVGGVGWKSGEIKDYQFQHPEKIIVTGFVPDEDLPHLYSQALCLVYPSFYEGFGLPVLEAMQCGIPVITSKVSSLPEVGGKAVFYIDPHNLNSIKESMLRIYHEENLRKKMIKEGFKQSTKFSWQKSAEKLNKLYQVL